MKRKCERINVDGKKLEFRKVQIEEEKHKHRKQVKQYNHHSSLEESCILHLMY
jgi:hypothetical protein